MRKAIFVPADNKNLDHFNNLEKSLRKFHSESEIALLRLDNPTPDMNWWYRAKPIIARELMENYDLLIGMDADQIITGPLDELWDDLDCDVKVVYNDPTYPIPLWDIQPYFNNGLVVLKSKDFVDHWYRLCHTEHFQHYQFREQDLLNILCSDYFNYKVWPLDNGNKIYGEFAKPLWAQARLEKDKIMVADKQICVIHFGGGSGDPSKGNYKIRFSPQVSKFIDGLLK